MCRVLPKHWPAEVRYLVAPVYSTALTADELLSIRGHGVTAPAPCTLMLPVPSTCVRILPITHPCSHPARGQSGLFAARDLAPDSLILDYSGLVHSSAEADVHSSYDLSLDRHRGIGIDAARMGNEARFVNDYRGIYDHPNAEFRERLVDGEKRMSVYVLPSGRSGRYRKGIRKGAEICVSYGKGFWQRLSDAGPEPPLGR